MIEADGQAVADFLRRMPKADLHCHLIGTVSSSTFADLVVAADIDLPASPATIYRDLNSLPPDPALYHNTRIPVPQGPSANEPEVSYPLFKVSDWVADALRSPDDVYRITYEAMENAYRESATQHLELFIDEVPPHLVGLGYAGLVDVYVSALQDAQRDFRMTGRLIQSIDRSRSADEATALVRKAIECGNDYIVGIGLANLETAGPPERFAEAYRLAGDAGLFRTAHSSEHAPTAVNTVTCLDVLGCDRIDHGYYVLEDDSVVERCRAEQVRFTVIQTTSRRSWIPWRKSSIKQMLAEGLNVLLASDDPGMFPTSLTREYQLAHDDLDVSLDSLIAMNLASFEAAWLPDEARSDTIQSVNAEMAKLRAELL